MKLRLAKASQLSWSWGLAWLSLAIGEAINDFRKIEQVFADLN